MDRYLKNQVIKDLQRKMVFIAGPRQVGKTTLALQLADPSRYFNWDKDGDREKILKYSFPKEAGILVFDEIHKYRSWRNYLKGFFDTKRDTYQILVTGSAKLDFYRFGGDSLQGRYHFLRMHPLSVAELKTPTALLDLFKLGGFPEPFFMSDQIEAKRWSREYRTRLIREELLSLERVDDLGKLELLMLRLPELVGSPLSINNLREDLQVNHKTVTRWLNVLERLYSFFRIPPLGAPKIQAVKKEQKHYHFDWTLIEKDGARFENLVACHLLKWVHYHQDTRGEEWDLRYFRDVHKREVDFVITDKRKPIMLVECKLDDEPIQPGLLYLKAKFPAAEAWQISLRGTKEYRSKEDIIVSSAVNLLEKLI